MITRNTVSEISLCPENSDPITTVQSTIEVNRRRRKTLAFEGDCNWTVSSDIAGETTKRKCECQFPIAIFRSCQTSGTPTLAGANQFLTGTAPKSLLKNVSFAA